LERENIMTIKYIPIGNGRESDYILKSEAFDYVLEHYADDLRDYINEQSAQEQIDKRDDMD